jgi:glutamine amidotransferase
MRELRSRRLDEFVRSYAAGGRPLLGICIGCQIILSLSEERETACLDIVPGRVVRFPDRPGLKVPHMGWNEVRQTKPSPLFEGIPDGSSFYFVHSYYPQPERPEQTVGTTDYGVEFVCAFERENISAVQFHPEKSGEWGIRLLSNYLLTERKGG